MVYHIVYGKKNLILGILDKDYNIIISECYNCAANVVRVQESDGFVYHLINQADGTPLMILDQNCHVLIPFASKIKYYPALEEGLYEHNIGYSDYTKKNRIEVWYAPAQPAFFYNGAGSIYDTSGNMIFGPKKNDSYAHFLPSDKRPLYLDVTINGKHGLYTFDGTEIAPPIYDYLYGEIYDKWFYFGDYFYDEYQKTYRKFSQPIESTDYYKILFIKGEIRSNGASFYGAIPIDPEAKQKYGTIPPYFTDITYQWGYPSSKVMVKKSDLDNKEEYDPTKLYSNKLRDLGEQYYMSHEYDKVIDYYSHNLKLTPWASVYSSMAFHEKGYEIYSAIETSYFGIFKDQTFIELAKRTLKEKSIDLQLMRSFFDKSAELFRLYQQTGDTEFITQDNEHILSMCNYYAYGEGYIEIKKKHDAIVDWIRQQEAEQAEQERRAAAERERIAQQNAQFWGAIFNAFAEGISNTFSALGAGSHSTYSSGNSYSTSSSYSGSSSSSSSSSSYSNSSSSSSNELDSYHQNNRASASNRIKQLERLIREYEGFLKDAEKEAAKAKAEGSAFYGSWLESINDYKKKIKQYQDEMNKLKREYGL